MPWSELNYYGKYEYFPLWFGFALSILGSVMVLAVVVTAVWIGVTESISRGARFGLVGLVVGQVLMFFGMFMDDTGFLLDTSWRKEYDELEYPT